ncbi:MAG: hypothetical protein H8E42_05485 [Nitrospinae bacterium]|nr:hypothetical protein [Nitrospinota bacterium]MBL7018918.1 hypothetical protein [Nitrospinaceae bacterium]
MDNKESKQTPQQENAQTPENFASELEDIRKNLKKRASDTTTLKILFYTGLAVLLFGFIYTNQTLQRAQHRNLESHIRLLQGQVNHTLIMLEKKLHEEILALDEKLSGTSSASFNERIQNMNQALDQLEPQSTSMGILIEKVQRNANELAQIVEAENQKEVAP